MRRGATLNPPSRHAAQRAAAFDDGWHQEPPPPLRTDLFRQPGSGGQLSLF